MYKFDMPPGAPDKPTIHHPCGRLTVDEGWGRDRQASENLRDHELWLVWHGQGWMASARRRYALRPGFCVWMRPGGVYDAGVEPGQTLGFSYIHFDGSAYRDPPQFMEVDDVAFFDGAMRRIIDATQAQTLRPWGRPAAVPRSAGLLLHSLLEDLIHQQLHPAHADDAPPHERRLDEVIAAIRAGQHPGRSVHDWADHLGVSPAHFSRQFSKRLGLSPQQFQTRARLERGRHLLAESALTVTQIADALGYGDPFAFSRQFKAHVGQSPTAYRSAAASGG